MGQVLVQKIILVTNGEHAHSYANLFSKTDRPKIDINVFAMKTTFWNRMEKLANLRTNLQPMLSIVVAMNYA
jgi:arabinogalactan endo-1,4-beta-galactosidase